MHSVDPTVGEIRALGARPGRIQRRILTVASNPRPQSTRIRRCLTRNLRGDRIANGRSLHAVCKDDVGAHWTLIGTDKNSFEMLRDASEEVHASLEIPADKFPLKRAGWPDEWAK